MKNFDRKNRYVIKNYHQQNTFSSFFPGIAGEYGIPLWVFYANRGQAITSFGSRDKDNPIMEFQPALKAYHDVRTLGFRTFIKNLTSGSISEPFSFDRIGDRSEMRIGISDLVISDLSSDLRVDVFYYTLANEAAGGLIRRVEITNNGLETFRGEVLDGMPRIVPFGSENDVLKNMTNTLTAWMNVDLIDDIVPFFRLDASTDDSALVSTRKCGNFSYAISFSKGHEQALPPIVDPELLFHKESSLLIPRGFASHSLDELYAQQQFTRGKFPCAFYGDTIEIQPGETQSLYSLYGQVNDTNTVCELLSRISTKETFAQKALENQQVIDDCLDYFRLHTGHDVFNHYARNTFLDNILRGGFPRIFPRNEQDNAVFHIYSRKHGDMERDYNKFALFPEYFSHGFGNYRDINQNRRCDIYFQPAAGLSNIREFCSLLQTDGFNPLIVHGIKFKTDYDHVRSLLPQAGSELKDFLSQPFSPGSLISSLKAQKLCDDELVDEIVARIIANSDIEYSAEFGEGYWIDHWTYNLDLIESYLSIFPDKRGELLFEDLSYTYFDSHKIVRPKHEKHIELQGKIRQSDAIVTSQEKQKLISTRTSSPHLMRQDHGRGTIYRGNLAEKLLCLLGLKSAALDAQACGVEMESGKPGWYDALNGLPGIFGSSMSETCELLRLANLLLYSVKAAKIGSLKLAEELTVLWQSLSSVIDEFQLRKHHFDFWRSRTIILETYRTQTLCGFSGKQCIVDAAIITGWLRKTTILLESAIESARSKTKSGLLPTFFRGEVTCWQYQTDKMGNILTTERGWKRVEVLEISYTPLPLFLEGVVKQLRIEDSLERKRELLDMVKHSDLYDRKLKMYRVNANLDSEPIDIGRARSFTPGWLENASIWLHMEYKFLLELLKGDLNEEFWKEADSALVPFMHPSKYGRSILENSSFIVSSVHPDASLHGRGFVARLSGSTAEFLHMLFLMLLGPHPFCVERNALCFRPTPKLPSFLFSDSGDLSFIFLGRTKITYHNPTRRSLYGPKRWDLISVLDNRGKREQILHSQTLTGRIAHQLRDCEIAEIKFNLLT